MAGWLALIPPKWIRAATIVFLFVAALFGFRSFVRKNAFREIETKELKRRIETIRQSKEIEDAVENMDDDDLVHAASKWLRHP